MSYRSRNSAVSQNAAADPLSTMIALSAVQPHEHVTILGRGYLRLLLGLCRRGIASVTARSPEVACGETDTAADVVWLLDAGLESQQPGTLRKLCRRLGSGGRLVIGDGRRPLAMIAALRRALAAEGLIVARTGGSALLCAERARDARSIGKAA